MSGNRSNDSNDSEIRLAELIWRTVKLRVSLLILTIVILLIVWAALSKGNEEAQQIDTKFCGYLVDQQNTVMKRLMEQSKTGSAILFSVQEECQATHSRTWIEITRNTDEELPWETSPPTLDFVKKAANEKKNAFQDYDIQRHAAYRLQIQLSAESSSSTVTVNALTVAKIVPFCVLIVLAIVTILGFQQPAYRRQLRFLLRNKQNDDLPRAIAETQFLAPPLQPMTSLAKRIFELSPMGLGIGTLLIASVFLLCGIISTFALTFAQLTNSIILSYPFALYASWRFPPCQHL